MEEIYSGREQTAAKHFILRKYLQSLAFKVLLGGYPTLTYVDGFSGPWEARTNDYSDTSFMIAIQMLKDAQQRIREQTGQNKNIRCFFVEADPAAFAELDKAVRAFHDPSGSFHVHTFCGRFEDSVDAVTKVIGTSFALTFIDPTGWTGYEFDRVRRIVGYKPGEVLLNFMFDHVNRFTAWDDPKIEASFDGILGAGWKARLDPLLPRDIAVQALFSGEFRKAGQFHHVLLTPIEKLADRPFFCIAYGTRKIDGLATYREVEFAALKDHGLRRIGARQAIETAKTGQMDLLSASGFSGPTPVEKQIPLIKADARRWLLTELRLNKGGCPFGKVWPLIIETFMLRKTDAGQICVELAAEGIVRASWRDNGSKRRTPNDADAIELTAKGAAAL
ncbi:three-Cys-motif partner protein TcmP [Mesorhizobium sp. M1423]|uniref:three-Cys-motif partner protein TcmP n=1 Tax=Mesorhizobium sp. M1423 TaxID=2957101 RepID=UPI00333B7A74